MKKKHVILLVLGIIILTIIGLKNNVYAAETEIKIGEEKSFTFSDLSVNGVVPTKITSANADNGCISVEEVKTGFLFWKSIGEIKIKGTSVGNTKLTIFYKYSKTTVDSYGKPTTTTEVGSKQFKIKVIKENATQTNQDTKSNKLIKPVDEIDEIGDKLINGYRPPNTQTIQNTETDQGTQTTKNTEKEQDTQKNKLNTTVDEPITGVPEVEYVTIKYRDKVLEPNSGVYRIGNENAQFDVELKVDFGGYWYLTTFRVENTKGVNISNGYQVKGGDGIVKMKSAYLTSFSETGDARIKILIHQISVGDKIVETFTGKEDLSAYRCVYNAVIPIKIVNEKDEGIKREPVTVVDVLDNMNYYKPGDIGREDAKKVESIVSNVLSVITTIGMIVTIIIPAILGIKYMLGSAEEKAEYKKDLVPYVVGAMLLFGICAVVKAVQGFGNQISSVVK